MHGNLVITAGEKQGIVTVIESFYAIDTMIKRYELTLPIRTVSEANQREHWGNKLKRKHAQQLEVSAEWGLDHRKIDAQQVELRFTRHSCQLMDPDNLAGAFKHIQDQVCKIIGIDDGDQERLSITYSQKKIGKREHYVTIELWY